MADGNWLFQKTPERGRTYNEEIKRLTRFYASIPHCDYCGEKMTRKDYKKYHRVCEDCRKLAHEV